MQSVKKTISISKEIVNQVIRINPNFSAVVEAALTEYIQHNHIKKAMESFGSWDKRKETSTKIVNDLRREDK